MAISVAEEEKKDSVIEKVNKKEKRVKNRNHYVDVLKGIAIIAVVFIHTVFHSGNSYVPSWFANCTVLFEVPIFIFLAGWSYSYSKSNKSYIQGMIVTQIKYMLFVVMIYIAINITNYIHFSNNDVSVYNLIDWLLHTYSNMKPFRGVEYSLWFFRIYFFVGLVGAMIITLVKPNIRKYILAICFISIFVITFFCPKVGSIDLGIELSYILFYMFFYILGYHMKDKKMSTYMFIGLMIVLVVALVGINYFSDMDVMQMEEHKFPPNFVFLLWSLFGVCIVTFLKKFFGDCKANILSKIGQNSMYIFFAQGVGSSVLYMISKYITMQWYYKVWIMFGINILVTTLVTMLLRIVLEPIGKWSRKVIKEKICS